MKKKLILAVLGGIVIASVFIGCSNFFEHDVKITNNSTRDVQFTIKNYGDTVYALESGESMTLELYNDPCLSFVGHPRVGYASHTSVNIFDLSSYKCIVYNHLPYDVVITEKNYRLGDESDDDGIVIGVNAELEKVLYTEKPSFIVKECGGAEREFSYTLKKYSTTTDGKIDTVYEVHIMI